MWASRSLYRLVLIAAAAVAGGMWSMPARSAPITHQLTLLEVEGSADPGATHVGTFVIDDTLLLPDAFIPFAAFDSFSITVGAYSFVLAGALAPLTEGVLTDGSGVVTMFEDLDPIGFVADIEAGTPSGCVNAPCLGLVGPVALPLRVWQLGQIIGGEATLFRFGTYSIDTVKQVPEPSTAVLFTLVLGLALGGRAGRRGGAR